jgi:hypothetical protein
MPWQQNQLSQTNEDKRLKALDCNLHEILALSDGLNAAMDYPKKQLRKIWDRVADLILPILSFQKSRLDLTDHIITPYQCVRIEVAFEFSDDEVPPENSAENKCRPDRITEKPNEKNNRNSHADVNVKQHNLIAEAIPIKILWAVRELKNRYSKLDQSTRTLATQRKDYHNYCVREMNPTKFIKDFSDDPSTIISSMMTAYIGTEMKNSKVNFTVKKIYIGVKSSKAAYLYQLQINMIQKTTTLVKFFDRPAGTTILKIVGTKDTELAEDMSQILYLELDGNSNKLVLGIFLTSSKKYKSVLSFPVSKDLLDMIKFFRMNRRANMVTFVLNTETVVVLKTINSKPEIEWYSNVASQCAQISISSFANQSAKNSNAHDSEADKLRIDGVVAEAIPHDEGKFDAITVIATTCRHIYLYSLSFSQSQHKPTTMPLGKYLINFNDLRDKLSQEEEFDMNVDNFKLNNMFLVPELNNKLIMIYVAINKERKKPNSEKEFPRIDILIICFEIHPENKKREDAYKDQQKGKNSSSEQPYEKPNPQHVENTDEELEIDCNRVLTKPQTYRIAYNDRDSLGGDWQNTKITIPDVKMGEDRLFMLLSSDSQKIQDLVIFQDSGLTHFSILDEVGQTVASVDHLQLWPTKSNSSVAILAQSIATNQRAIRDLTLDITLAQPIVSS